jgi:hypothetical protein
MISGKIKKFLPFFIIALLLLCGCASSPQERKADALSSALEKGLYKNEIQAGMFKLMSLHSDYSAMDSGPVRVVIEGDGFAYVNRYTASGNPTPINPVGLQIALNVTRPVVYLARPCQYVEDSNCTPLFWTNRRFDNSVIGAMNLALDKIKASPAQKLYLIGFSGGAYIAMVLAAIREDVVAVDTVSGLLDPDEWTSFHGVSPLYRYYSSEALLSKAQDVEFSHYCSPQDKVLPCELHQRFMDMSLELGFQHHRLINVSGYDHEELWRYYIEQTQSVY